MSSDRRKFSESRGSAALHFSLLDHDIPVRFPDIPDMV